MDIEDLRDISKKYNNTFAKLKLKDKWTVVYIQNIRFREEDPNYQIEAVVSHSNKDSIKVLANLEEFDFDFPPIGCINFMDTVAIAAKYPARQWKKAATHENYRVYLPLNKVIDKIRENKYEVGYSTTNFEYSVLEMEQLFNNKYYTLSEAKDLIFNSKRFACAITPEFFIIPSMSSYGYTLIYKNIPVAEFIDTQVVFLNDKLKQEVEDFLRSKHAR